MSSRLSSLAAATTSSVNPGHGSSHPWTRQRRSFGSASTSASRHGISRVSRWLWSQWTARSSSRWKVCEGSSATPARLRSSGFWSTLNLFCLETYATFGLWTKISTSLLCPRSTPSVSLSFRLFCLQRWIWFFCLLQHLWDPFGLASLTRLASFTRRASITCRVAYFTRFFA